MMLAPSRAMMHLMTVSYLFPPEDAYPGLTSIDEADDAVKKRDTKAIGDRSELEVVLALARAGFLVSKPLCDSFRYDLVIDDGEKRSRVQVKTGRLRGGSIKVPCYSTHSQGPTVRQRSYRGEIDLIGVFCPQTGNVYMVPESGFVDSTMHLHALAGGAHHQPPRQAYPVGRSLQAGVA